MPTTENKVRFGLKNVHIAEATIAADGTATFETPWAFPGAVAFNMDAQGDRTVFRADDSDYWTGYSNNGYEGDLEMARMIDDFKTKILQYIKDSKGGLVEVDKPDAQHFAMMFEFDGDQKATRHVLYNCTASRPSTSGNTTPEGSVEPETETSTISAGKIYVEGFGWVVKYETTADTDTNTYNNWYTTVQLPTAGT